MNHAHEEHSRRPRRLLLGAAAWTGVTFLAEAVGAWWSGSVALLSDAGHVFMDLTALLFSFAALRLAERPTSDERTFGFHRAEVLAALVNGLLVAGVALGIAGTAWSHWRRGATPQVAPMLALGTMGLVVNLLVAWRLHGHARDLNLRSAFLHVASDALASVGVILGGIILRFTGWAWIDPLVGGGIAVVIFVGAARLIRESLHILLEGAPRHLRVADIRAALEGVPGVHRVEDAHLWALCSHLVMFTAHLSVTASPDEWNDLRQNLRRTLRDRFEIAHATLEFWPSVTR
jgi:cobalt-zinc-cadmium efflux system protein